MFKNIFKLLKIYNFSKKNLNTNVQTSNSD